MKCRFMLFIEAINTKDPTKQAEETQKRDNNLDTPSKGQTPQI